MTTEQTKELEVLKSALKQHIKEAEKSTPGPWTWRPKFLGSAEIDEARIWLGESSSMPFKQPHLNAAFIARARTMSPLACRIALAGIEALEEIDAADKDDEMGAWKDLNDILALWKGGEA